MIGCRESRGSSPQTRDARFTIETLLDHFDVTARDRPMVTPYSKLPDLIVDSPVHDPHALNLTRHSYPTQVYGDAPGATPTLSLANRSTNNGLGLLSFPGFNLSCVALYVLTLSRYASNR